MTRPRPKVPFRYIAALSAGAILGASILFSCNGDNQDQAEEVTQTSVSKTPSVRPSAKKSTPPPTTSSIAPPPAPPANEGEAPALVGSFSMDGPATITGATYDSMPYVLPLNPAGPQQTMVRWVEGWGQSPATAEQGTTYVLGHAWGQMPLVFNPISETVTANVDFNNPELVAGDEGMRVEHFSTDVLNGSTVRMESPDGNAREWVIDTAYLVDKNTAAYDTHLIDTSVPGRLVLIACSVDGTTDLGYNVIVEGHLA